ncbi:carbohydrate sulfotransferase 11-like [Mizuhopecten yessoensis]|uniref:carbohydrate sulfotransferase 11-like n=1 Tax=Mizuhopecten yessoensis TaxID=6573 RepID=UPI000B45AA5D|nr:carbohydrate sulfotransferase 11-like [Mizuhopecten yessoensis]
MVQKVGCTFWRRVFYSLKHKEISNIYSINNHKVHDKHIPTLGQFDVIEAKRVLRSATTAMFVREPYERAFSGYLDKLHTINPNYMKNLGRPIIKMMRKNATTKSLNCGHDVTFTELIRYLVEQKRNGQLLNIDHHFSPIYTHCLPCDIKYDFIGKMESFDEDTSYVMSKTNMFQNKSISMSKNASIIDDLYTKMIDAFNAQKTMSDCMTLREMYGRVWRTLQLRGLVNPDVPMPDSQNVTLDMMLREAVKVSDPSRVSEYKHEGFVKMYKTVDRQLLLEFREYVLKDCKLFGYDDKPPDLFSWQR